MASERSRGSTPLLAARAELQISREKQRRRSAQHRRERVERTELNPIPGYDAQLFLELPDVLDSALSELREASRIGVKEGRDWSEDGGMPLLCSTSGLADMKVSMTDEIS